MIPGLVLWVTLALGAVPDAGVDALFDLAPAPVGARELSLEQRLGARVHDLRLGLTTAAGKSPAAEVPAYLVEPLSSGRHPAVLFVHWLGEPRTTNRSEFFDEALALARQEGVVSLLIDAQWAEKDWFDKLERKDDVATSVKAVLRVRRALDFLAARPSVDVKRIALVGHDFGAMYGAIAGALDGRPRTYVLVTPTPHLADWFLLGAKPEELTAYRQGIAPLDPVRYLPRLRGASILFQFAEKDRYVTRAQADELLAAAPEPRSVLRYDTDHALSVAQARADRWRWLKERLVGAP